MSVVQQLGVTVLHSLWQGFFVYLISRMPALKSLVESSRIRLIFALIIFQVALSIATFGIVSVSHFNSSFGLQEADLSASGGDQMEGTRDSLSDQNPGDLVLGNGETSVAVAIDEGGRFAGLWSIAMRFVGMMWFPGVLTSIFFSLFRLSGTKRLGQQLTPIDQPDIRRINQCCASTLGIPISGLYHHKRIMSPVVLGLLRFSIILPVAMVNSQDENLIRAVLLHEYQHIFFQDGLWQYLAEILGALYFFHPAIREMIREMQVLREMRADDGAAKVLGDPVAYSQLLVDWGRGALPATIKTGLSAFSGSTGDLRSRIQRLLGFKVQPQRRSLSLVAPLLLASVILALIFAGGIGASRGISALQHQQNLSELAEISQKLGTGIDAVREMPYRIEVQYQGDLEEREPPQLHIVYGSDLMSASSSEKGRKQGDVIIYEGSVNASYINFSFQDLRWAPWFSQRIAEVPESGRIEMSVNLLKTEPTRIAFISESGSPVDLPSLVFMFEPVNSQVSAFPHIPVDLQDDGSVVVYTDPLQPYALTFLARAPGYADIEETVNPDGEMVFTLHAVVASRFRVLDLNGRPMRNHGFSVIPGYFDEISHDPPEQIYSDEAGYIELILSPRYRSTVLSYGGPEFTAYAVIDHDTPARRIRFEDQRFSGAITGVMGDQVHISFRFNIDTQYSSTRQDEIGVDIEAGKAEFSLPLEWPVTGFDVHRQGQFLYAADWDIRNDEPVEISLQEWQPGQAADALSSREIELAFRTPEGLPPVNGNISLEMLGASRFDDYGYENHFGFVYADVVNGRAVIHLLSNIEQVKIDSFEVSGYYFDSSPIPVPAEAGQVAISLHPAASVSGSVRFSNGSAPRNAHIVLRDEDDSIVDQVNSRNGNYQFSSLTPGKRYSISASAGMSGDSIRRFRASGDGSPIFADLRISRGKDIVINLIDDVGNHIPGATPEIRYEHRNRDASGLVSVSEFPYTVYNFDPREFSHMMLLFGHEGRAFQIDLLEKLRRSDGALQLLVSEAEPREPED